MLLLRQGLYSSYHSLVMLGVVRAVSKAALVEHKQLFVKNIPTTGKPSYRVMYSSRLQVSHVTTIVHKKNAIMTM